MSFVGSLFGSDSGDTGGAGMNYQARGPEQYQLNDAWANSQNGLGQQQQFLNQLAAQGGVQNQSDVFNQQQGLAGQLALQASGAAGPSIAQSQYQQNMNALAAQQAGAMGSQKGMSPALQARMVAQQGANAQQNAAGQYATMGAQEQWAALQALQNQQANMANMANTQVAQRQAGLNAYNQGASNQQANLYRYQTGATNANAGIANTTAQGQQGVFGGVMNAMGGAMGMAHGGQVPGYAAGGVAMAPITSANFGNDLMSAANATFGGGSAPSGVGADMYQAPSVGVQGPQSQAGQQLQASNPGGGGGGIGGGGSNPGAAAIAQGMGSFLGGLMGGGAKKQMDGMMGGGGGGGEDDGGGGGSGMMSMLPMLAMALNKGGSVPCVTGEKYSHKMKPVPGKAKVKGDSKENDTVPAKLSPGEIIIPRSVAMSPNAPELAAKFVAAVKAKQGRGIG